jgi:SAM-dependent methyltransferase
MYYLKHKGYCPICEQDVTFKSKDAWLRDHFLCSGCKSIPRERALMAVIDMYFSNYQELAIHESSPSHRGVSFKLKKKCRNYTESHYFPDIVPGEIHVKTNYQCQNLEQLTFGDESFDLFITQDVLEHVFRPEKVFQEIARVLRPGGAHIFTVPIINKGKKSECWASLDDNEKIIFHGDPEYHGNPIDNKGSLVTMHWGYDIAEYIQHVASTPTTIVMINNLDLGIRAEFIEVLVSRKY